MPLRGLIKFGFFFDVLENLLANPHILRSSVKALSSVCPPPQPTPPHSRGYVVPPCLSLRGWGCPLVNNFFARPSLPATSVADAFRSPCRDALPSSLRWSLSVSFLRINNGLATGSIYAPNSSRWSSDRGNINPVVKPLFAIYVFFCLVFF